MTSQSQPQATEGDIADLSPMDEDDEHLDIERADKSDSTEDGWGPEYEAPPYDADDADDEETEDEAGAAYDDHLDRYMEELVSVASAYADVI